MMYLLGRRRKRSWDFFSSNTPPELVQSFVSTESDRSESQDAVTERIPVEVRHHDSHYVALEEMEEMAHEKVVERPRKRVVMGSTRGDDG